MLNITCIIFLSVPIIQFVVNFFLLSSNVTSAKSFKLHVTGCWIFIRLNQKVFLCVYGTSYKKHPCFGVFGFGSANRLVVLFLIFLPISSFSLTVNTCCIQISQIWPALDHYKSVSGIYKDGYRIVKILTHSGKGHQAHRIKRAYIGLLGIDL